MAHAYRAVGWNPQKKKYDRTLVAGVVLFLAVFVGSGLLVQPNITAETLVIRAFGSAALLLLHVVLCIGPLARLDRRFLPLLYNRRHMGVTMFLLALVHGGFSLVQFHAFGNENPVRSLFLSNTNYASLAEFPFQPLGACALAILFLMAATSHDFWLANLTPPVWKGLHMLVYVAYGLVVAHVALGQLQAETSPLLVVLMALGMLVVFALHLVAGAREAALDHDVEEPPPGTAFVRVATVEEIPEDRAKVVCVGGERVAIYHYDGKVSAVSSVCQHQNGPLGEGRVIDGCITCPWHGYQYNPESGSSPAPFDEKVPTFHVQVAEGFVFLDPRPNPPGTPVPPAVVDA